MGWKIQSSLGLCKTNFEKYSSEYGLTLPHLDSSLAKDMSTMTPQAFYHFLCFFCVHQESTLKTTTYHCGTSADSGKLLHSRIEAENKHLDCHSCTPWITNGNLTRNTTVVPFYFRRMAIPHTHYTNRPTTQAVLLIKGIERTQSLAYFNFIHYHTHIRMIL